MSKKIPTDYDVLSELNSILDNLEIGKELVIQAPNIHYYKITSELLLFMIGDVSDMSIGVSDNTQASDEQQDIPYERIYNLATSLEAELGTKVVSIRYLKNGDIVFIHSIKDNDRWWDAVTLVS